MPRNNMPENWNPPAPAWQSVWEDTSDPIVAGYFGIQADDSSLLDDWIAKAFSADHGPQSVEQGRYIDQAGVTNTVYIAYWRDSSYRKWWQAQAAWWQDDARLSEGVGYWREIIVMPFKQFETLHSTETSHGAGVLADGLEGPIDEHGYPGGARDRILLSDSDDLKNIPDISVSLEAIVADDGKRVVVRPPEKMCVIRSGQNWSVCDGKEKDYYLQNVQPVLIKGMEFLRDNPEETNCYSLRFIQKHNADKQVAEETFGLGYATDIYVFENWAKSHPTHLAIFDSFMQMVGTFGEEMKLKLWHEVIVLPKDGCEFEYIACHPQTGLLSYA